jgi:hypothetical protein
MENSSYVKQGTYKIRNKSLGPLITGGLATCSAISFIINDNDIFMSHIDAKTDVRKIANDIKKLYPSKLDINNVKIWYGSSFGQHDSTITQKLILTFTQYLDINIIPFKESCHDIIQLHNQQNNQIIQCRICNAQSGTLLIIPHCFNCQYNNPVQIYHVGFMDNVSS